MRVSDPLGAFGAGSPHEGENRSRAKRVDGIVFGLQANLVNCRRYFPLSRRSTSFPFAYLWTRLEISV